MKPPKKLIKSENIRLRECVLTFDGAHTPKSGLLKTKICTKCGKKKLLSKFSKHKNNKDGHTYWCKQCKSIIAKKYSEDNRDVIKQKKKKYWKANREKLLVRKRKYRQLNKAELNAKQKRRYWLNPEEYRKLGRQYQKEHRTQRNEYLKKWRNNNIEKAKAIAKRAEDKKTKILANSYVNKVLCERNPLMSADIPIELTKAKREYMKLGRLLKGNKNEDNQGSKRKIG